jgi:hypothetical protein
MPFTDKTKNIGQTQTTQTLAPTPYIKEQTPAQRRNLQTQTTPQQQQKSQHPNLITGKILQELPVVGIQYLT